MACHMEVTEESVDNGAIVEADINLGVRMLDLYQAVGDQDSIVEIDLQIVRYDPKYEYKASISINRTPCQVALAWYNHKKTEEGKDDKLSYVQFALKQGGGSDALSVRRTRRRRSCAVARATTAREPSGTSPASSRRTAATSAREPAFEALTRPFQGPRGRPIWCL